MMAFIALGMALVAMLVLVLNKTLHKKLAQVPLAGLALFTGLLALGIWFFGNMWQFYMAYAMMLLMAIEYLALSLIRNKKMQVTMKFNRRVLVICTYMTLAASLLFFPLKHLPDLATKNPVGSWRMVVESADRQDTLAKVDGVKRRYAVTLYYPLETDQGKAKKWLDSDISVKGMALSYGLPQLTIGYFGDVEAHAKLSKQIQGSGPALPVVVISHGSKSSSEQFTRLAENLAAEGAVVAVINHPYSAYATILGKGEYTLGAKSAAAQMDYVDQKIELERQLTLAQQGDLVETFKLLERINQGEYDNRFKGRLDLSDMLLVGHQLGGGSVLATLNQMPFVSAAILFNPIVEQLPKSYILSGSAKPVMGLMTTDYLKSNNASYMSRYLEGSKSNAFYQPSRGKDLDMLDLASFSPLFKMSGLSEGLSARETVFKAQLAICREAIDIYCRGQIFEKLDQQLDLKALKLKPLEPQMIDAN